MPIANFTSLVRKGLLGVLFMVNIFNSVYADERGEFLDTQLNERIIYVPVQDAPQVKLQVTLFTPEGAGPFPLAVLNHGKDPGMPRNEKRYRSVYAARYFLSRGYAVAIPMMRGFAGSEGKTWVTGCNLERMAVRHGRDIGEVIKYLGAHPEAGVSIDPNKVVIFGQSMGGWNTLGAGSLNIPGVKGLVNFAGGLNAPDCPGWQHDLSAAAAHFGEHTNVPSIWFYGNNDSKFAMPVWRSMVDRYNLSGGEAEMVAYGNFMDDSHGFLGRIEALPVWTPRMDDFLQRIGLPFDNLRPALLPAPYPASTLFADLHDINALPKVNARGREEYKIFLKKTMPKAFVIADDGVTYSTVGGYDPLEQAMGACKQQHSDCRVYAVDDQVVWELSDKLPPATSFAKLGNELNRVATETK